MTGVDVLSHAPGVQYPGRFVIAGLEGLRADSEPPRVNGGPPPRSANNQVGGALTRAMRVGEVTVRGPPRHRLSTILARAFAPYSTGLGQ